MLNMYSSLLANNRLATDLCVLPSFQNPLFAFNISNMNIVGHFSSSMSSLYEYIPKFIIGTGLGAGIACDIVITVSMCYYLQKSRTGFKRYVLHRHGCS